MSQHVLSRLPVLSLAAVPLLVSACSNTTVVKEEPKTVTASLSRTLTMVDKEGKVYGTVVLDPVGGGKVMDADGRMIGTIKPPER